MFIYVYIFIYVCKYITQGILVNRIDLKILVLIGSRKLEGWMLISFYLCSFCQNIVTEQRTELSLNVTSIVTLFSLKSLLWFCFRIISNHNHMKKSGNEFFSLLGWLSLVNLYLFLSNGLDCHPGNSLWECVVEESPCFTGWG